MVFGLFGVIAVCAIAYYHARTYKLDLLQAPIVSLLSFIVLAAPIVDNNMDATYLGSQGIFLAIFVALVTVEIMQLLKRRNIQIKLPDSVPPAVAASFDAIIPMCLIVAGFYGLSLLCQNFTGMLLPSWIMSLLTPAIQGSEFIMVLYVDGIYYCIFTILGSTWV